MALSRPASTRRRRSPVGTPTTSRLRCSAGIVLIRSMDPLDVVRLPVPGRAPRRARAARTSGCARRRRAPCCRGTCPARSRCTRRLRWRRWWRRFALDDYALLGRAVDDRIAEPARAGSCRASREAKAAALAAGALGSSISGSGPDGVRARARARERASGSRAAMARGLPRARRQQQRARGAGGPRRRDGDPRGAGAMRFQTERPASWQVCARLRQRADRDRSRTRAAAAAAACSRSVHRPPDLTARRAAASDSPSAAAAARRTAVGRLAIPRDRAAVGGGDRLPSRGEHAAAPPRGAGPLDRHRSLLLKHEGHNPTGSFKDRGMTVGVTQALADRRARRGLRLHRQHLGLARGVCGAGGTPRARAGARGQRGPGQAGAVARLRRAHAPGARRLRRLSPAGAGGERAARRLPAQLDQPVPARGAEDDRARAAAAARLGSAGLDRAARPATWGTPPRSGRRCGRRASGG